MRCIPGSRPGEIDLLPTSWCWCGGVQDAEGERARATAAPATATDGLDGGAMWAQRWPCGEKAEAGPATATTTSGMSSSLLVSLWEDTVGMTASTFAGTGPLDCRGTRSGTVKKVSPLAKHKPCNCRADTSSPGCCAQSWGEVGVRV